MEYMLILLEIILINLVLSGDNAVVIAMASRKLPESQRRRAIWLGSGAAVLLRILLTFAAVYLLQIPYIQAVGSVLLTYIAIKLVTDTGVQEDVREAATLASAIGVILLADFVMSLDNVLAIAAAAGRNYGLIAVGIALSIPLIVWGSTLVMKLLGRFPLLIHAGAGILGYTAGEMFSEEERILDLFGPAAGHVHRMAPIIGAAFVLAVDLAVIGIRRRRHKARREKDSRVSTWSNGSA